MRQEARAWWDEAQAELEAAHHLLESGDFSVCAFFCQQSAEKALKALWIHSRKRMAPKTHDITDLGAQLVVPDKLKRALKELNPLFATTRYPDAANGVPARMYDEEIANERLRDAEEVMAWCRNELGLS